MLTIYSQCETDINRILMNSSQQDLKIFLKSSVNAGSQKCTHHKSMETTEPHYQRQQERESKEIVSAGQPQMLCHYQSQSSCYQIHI